MTKEQERIYLLLTGLRAVREPSFAEYANQILQGSCIPPLDESEAIVFFRIAVIDCFGKDLHSAEMMRMALGLRAEDAYTNLTTRRKRFIVETEGFRREDPKAFKNRADNLKLRENRRFKRLAVFLAERLEKITDGEAFKAKLAPQTPPRKPMSFSQAAQIYRAKFVKDR